ncbi:ANKRD50, partial [Symbiodinium sp. KB8]
VATLHGRTLWLSRSYCCGHALIVVLFFARFAIFLNMLQLRMLSGEAVTSIPVEEIQDVKGLKQRLSDLHGLPPRFRQRVFFHGEPLKDDMTLDSPMNLDLVLLTFADVSQRQVDELAAAALQGSLSEVESLMQLPQDPDLIVFGQQPALTIASFQGYVEVVRLLLE